VSGSPLGASLRRREDPRLITGQSRFVDDLPPEGGLHAAFVRSPVAHGRIRDLDLEPARRLPGVVTALSAQDLGLPSRLAFAVVPEVFARPPLAVDLVRFVGEAVAVVVAETRAAAVDAAEAVLVDYERLPAVVGPLEAASESAPLLFPEHGSNLAFEVAFGDDTDPLAGAEVVIRGRFRNQRLAAVPIEPNAVLAAPDHEGKGLVLWASTQSPFQVRDFVADCLGLDESAVRCVAPDVGGAFGSKLPTYPEQAVVAELARRLGRSVRWIETRSESFLALAQGRGQIQHVELGAERQGRLCGLRVELLADAGAYPGQGAFLPFLTGQMLAGPYRLPRIQFHARSYATNSTPTAAYRGAGRPEATALLERAMDLLASELRMDPVQLRRSNLIPPQDFPHETVTGASYDSGAYEEALDKALELAGYERLRTEQRQRREAGDRRQLGIGLSCYVEVTALGSPTEYASIEARPEGGLLVLAGTASHGQGHETTYAQIAAGALGTTPDTIQVVQGDTGRVPRGDGTSSSRSVQLAGSAVLLAAAELLERARGLAGELLEADRDDVVTVPEGLAVRGAPGSALSWGQLALAAQERGEPPLRAQSDVFAEPSYPFGTHLAVAEVDVETGEACLVRHVAVDDCGTVVNPLLADGQVHGGVAQGVGQALYEEVIQDADGNPLTASLLDYLIPSANEMPPLETARTVTPSPNNALGAKGIGESGTIGATPAVQNAVIDALAHLGVRHVDMPLTPERIWRSIRGGPAEDRFQARVDKGPHSAS
jgi:carbon-monoxide dehydrogenase large subunit